MTTLEARATRKSEQRSKLPPYEYVTDLVSFRVFDLRYLLSPTFRAETDCYDSVPALRGLTEQLVGSIGTDGQRIPVKINNVDSISVKQNMPGNSPTVPNIGALTLVLYEVELAETEVACDVGLKFNTSDNRLPDTYLSHQIAEFHPRELLQIMDLAELAIVSLLPASEVA